MFYIWRGCKKKFWNCGGMFCNFGAEGGEGFVGMAFED